MADYKTRQVRANLPHDTADMVDLKTAAQRFVLPGFIPPEPFLERNAGVFAIGSCFAEHAVKHLIRAGATNVMLGSVGEVHNTPGQSSAYLGEIASGRDEEARKALSEAKLFILTLGLAQQMFLDGREFYGVMTPKTALEGSWRLLTVDEICTHVRSIFAKIRSINPDIHIVVSLSPIPLRRSIGHASAFGQDCMSKSLLRVAIATLMQDDPPLLSYWPSFEIIRWLGGHIGPFFGVGGEDNRHIFPDTLDVVMELFVESYYRKVG